MAKKSLLFLAILSVCTCMFAACQQAAPVENGSIEELHREIGQSKPDTSETKVPEENEFILLLREYANFDRSDTAEAAFIYDMTSPNLKELSDTYNLPEIAGTGDTQEKAINLLAWLSENVYHYGNYDNHVEQNSLALLDYALQKGEENGINCMGLSITLTEMLLSQGIPARTLWLMPGDPEDMDNHVATIAYIKAREQWIFLDPTYNAYFTNDAGDVLSPQQMRDAMVTGGTLPLNDDAHYNGYAEVQDTVDEYIQYLAKDFFYFYSYDVESFGRSINANLRHLCPSGFDVIAWEIANLKFRNNSEYNPAPLSEEELENRCRQIREAQVNYTAPDDFWAEPDPFVW